MVANKLPATVLAQVFLLVIAGFAVSLYILPTATGTANGILSFHTSNIPCLRCFLFARRLSAYILGHHLRLLGLSRCANNTCRCASCSSRSSLAHPTYEQNHRVMTQYSHPPKASYCVASPRRTNAYCLRRRALSETFGGWLYYRSGGYGLRPNRPYGLCPAENTAASGVFVDGA